MTIQHVSDLHLEFPENEAFVRNNPLPPGADILLIAGDLLQFKSMKQHDWFFDYVAENFGTTYWIAGNHEYYNSDLAEKRGTFNDAIRDNVFLVNDYAVTHENVRFVFATMWTHISQRNAITIARQMNDFHLIRYNGKRLTAEDLETEHKQSVKFIEDELFAERGDLKTVVVTHHVPTFLHYPPEYLGDALNEAFAIELKALIRHAKPDYWIFGHHHVNIPPFQIDDTLVLTNQLGYVRSRENALFDPGKRIEISGRQHVRQRD